LSCNAACCASATPCKYVATVTALLLRTLFSEAVSSSKALFRGGGLYPSSLLPHRLLLLLLLLLLPLLPLPLLLPVVVAVTCVNIKIVTRSIKDPHPPITLHVRLVTSARLSFS